MTSRPAGPVIAFVGLGSNLGDRAARIEAAIQEMDAVRGLQVLERTGLMETAPWGFEPQPHFLNAIARVSTTLEPDVLMTTLKGIEAALGRTPSEVVWGPREIDLDILLYGERVVDSPHLKVPHPRMLDRRFIIEQLVELDASIIHPTTGVPIFNYLGQW